MTSWFTECFGCAKRKKPKEQRPTFQRTTTTSRPPLRPIQTQNPPAVVTVKPPAPRPAPCKIQSTIPKEQIQVQETMPEKVDRKLFKYSCPICFRYFTHMLECIECKNYVCRLCVEDIATKPYNAVRCPFCDKQPFILSDVSEMETVKKYTDTPYSSVASGFKFTGGLVQLKAAKHAPAEASIEDSVKVERVNQTFMKLPTANDVQPGFAATTPEFWGKWNQQEHSVILGRNCIISNGVKYYRCHKTMSECGGIDQENRSELANSERAENMRHSAREWKGFAELPSKFEKESEIEYASEGSQQRMSWDRNQYRNVELPVDNSQDSF